MNEDTVRDDRGHRFFMLDDVVFDQFIAKIGASAFVLYAGFARHADSSGRCWPGLEGIAEKTGLSRATLFTALKALREAGLVEVTKRPNPHGGDRNEYRLLPIGFLYHCAGSSRIETPVSLNSGLRSVQNLDGGPSRIKTEVRPDSGHEEDSVEEDSSEVKNHPPSPPVGGIARTKFVVPSDEEVLVYFTEKGHHSWAEGFLNHYKSNGWRVGKNPMKDWRAAAAGWISRQGRQVFDAPVNGRNGSVKQDRTGEEVVADLIGDIQSRVTRFRAIRGALEDAQQGRKQP